MSGPLLKFTDRLVEIIDDISGPVAEMLLRIEGDPLLDNYLDIETVDVSKREIKMTGRHLLPPSIAYKIGSLVDSFGILIVKSESIYSLIDFRKAIINLL